NPALFGQTLTFTATISIGDPSAGTPTGTVQFQIDGNDAGSPVSVSTSGDVTTAAFSATSRALGSPPVTSNYSGPDCFAASSWTLAAAQTVNQARSLPDALPTANPALFGQTLTFTATISIGDPGAGTPSGTVQFQIDGNDAGSPVSVSTSGDVTTASFS